MFGVLPSLQQLFFIRGFAEFDNATSMDGGVSRYLIYGNFVSDDQYFRDICLNKRLSIR